MQKVIVFPKIVFPGPLPRMDRLILEGDESEGIFTPTSGVMVYVTKGPDGEDLLLPVQLAEDDAIDAYNMAQVIVDETADLSKQWDSIQQKK